MTDVGFMGQIYDILDEKHFDNDSLKWIVKECKVYYNEYKKPITLDVFKVKVNDIQNDILKTGLCQPFLFDLDIPLGCVFFKLYASKIKFLFKFL